MHIQYALKGDLAEILQLQYEAFQSEADLYKMDIPPMQQSLASLQEEYAYMTFLIAVKDDEIIGSVRAYEENGICYICKLIVSPIFQNQGIGSQLMLNIEHIFTHVSRFELFTGHLSEKNLALYNKLGYTIYNERRIDHNLVQLYMFKQNK